MAIDLHWGEFLYSHHTCVLPFSRTQGCCVVYNTEHWHMPLLPQHKPCKESTGASWKTQEERGVEQMAFLWAHPISQRHFQLSAWRDITLGEQNILCRHKKVTRIMIARSEIKLQSKYWKSITYFLEQGAVPLVNCTPSSNFVLNANTVLRSVVPVQVHLCAQRTARWLVRVRGAESKSSRPWTTCQGASRTLQTVASWFYTWKSGRQRTNTLSHSFTILLFSVLQQGGKDL